MIDKYTDIMYEGSYDHPVTITFNTQGYKMIVTGEGGNRHLILIQDGLSVDLWIDTHISDRKNENSIIAFISSIRVESGTDGQFVHYIYRRLLAHCRKIDRHCFYFRAKDLDAMFKEIYEDMKGNYISRF